MTLNLNDHWKEQFFTPYHVAEAMARMTIDASAKEREWFSLGESKVQTMIQFSDCLAA